MVRKNEPEKPAPAPAAKAPAPASAPAGNYGQPTPLPALGSMNFAKPSTYKLKIDNQTYFAEVEQIS